MKKDKMIYWASTGIVGVMMIFSAFMYITNPTLKEAFEHVGFPNFFRIELAIAKLLGAIVLLLPFFKGIIKQFAFFGFGLTFVSAFIAHMSVGDPIGPSIMPLVFLGILVVSYIYYNRLQEQVPVSA